MAALVKAQSLIIKENFQDWRAEIGTPPEVEGKPYTGVSYTITKKLYDGKTNGTFTSNALIVNPEQKPGKAGIAEGNGSPTNGCIVLKGSKSYLQLPQIPSISRIIIKAKSGSDLIDFKLQASNDSKTYKDIPESLTTCSNSVIKSYVFDVAYNEPTTIRILSTSGSSIYVFDIEVYTTTNL